MAEELCTVLLQAVYLTLDSTTDIGVFLSMQYFTYFMCNPIASSLCDTKHPLYIKIVIGKLKLGVYIQYFTFFCTLFTH